MRVARLNFAHGTPEEHRETVARIRAAERERERPVAILQDLAGPKLRLGRISDAPVALEPGDDVVLASGESSGRAPRLPVPDEQLPSEVRVGGPILLADGAVELEVRAVAGREIRCRVVVGGAISSGKGINVPGGLAARPILDAKDQADLELGCELGVDFVGVSYVRTADDLGTVRRRLRSLGRPTPIVAKIETGLALENLDAILAHTDAVMVARGDLSLEIPYERVPVEQKRIVRAAIQAGRPVVAATQMLQSMVAASRPTRAEATDVANAVLDGTDAVMLSDETAVGVDPVRACGAMARIALETEAALPEGPPEPDLEGVDPELRELAAFARASVRTASDTGARAIVAWSRGGLAARLISRQRPRVPVLAPTRYPETCRRLTLPWGIEPILCPSGRMSAEALRTRLGPVGDGDLLLAVGHSPGEQRRIPWMSLVRVSDSEGWAVDPRGGRGPAFP
jgi:pyruvate kinase